MFSGNGTWGGVVSRKVGTGQCSAAENVAISRGRGYLIRKKVVTGICHKQVSILCIIQYFDGSTFKKFLIFQDSFNWKNLY